MTSATETAAKGPQALLTKAEAADLLAVSVRTVDRMRTAGEIETVLVRSLVRIPQSSVERYIGQQLAPAAAEVPAKASPFAIPLLEELKAESAARRAKKLEAAA